MDQPEEEQQQHDQPTEEESPSLSPLLQRRKTTSARIALSGVSQSRSAPRQAQRSETFLFFLSGVGSTVGWTAVLSNLVFYSATLGMNSYLYLNLAVFFPLLPVAIAQAQWDSHFDRQFNSLLAFSFRGAFGFIFSLVSVLLIPLVSFNLTALSFTTFILGLASSLLKGTMKQMASFVYPDCKTLPAAVAGGMQASAVLVLAVSVLTGFGGTSSSSGLYPFYLAIAAIIIACWVGFAFLMRHSDDVWNSMRQRDSSIGSLATMVFDSSEESVTESLLAHRSDTEESPTADRERIIRANRELTNRELWLKTWPACAALAVTVASSMAVGSWFNRFSSTDPSNQSLPQVMFYTRLFSDLLGRPTTLLIKPKSMACVGTVALIRFFCCPYFFLYASQWGKYVLPRNDFAIVAAVSAFAFTSGYIATACYQLAPDLLTSTEGRSVSGSIPKQTSLVNICFGASILVGVAASFSFLFLGAGQYV